MVECTPNRYPKKNYVVTNIPGRVVACAAMDSADANLNNPGFLAIESLGSNLIRNISFRVFFYLFITSHLT